MMCRALIANTLNILFSLLFYATWDPTRIYKANLDGSDITEIVTTGLSNVPSIAINYDKKRICWADICKCCTSLSPKKTQNYFGASVMLFLS